MYIGRILQKSTTINYYAIIKITSLLLLKITSFPCYVIAIIKNYVIFDTRRNVCGTIHAWN